ncbi:MAG: polysaccharide pyruvyl transferase family protein [Oscillochloridaceae bacterium umkhey_bin13]
MHSHLHDLGRVEDDNITGVEFLAGYSPLYWRWYTIIRHLHLPALLHEAVAFVSLPVFLLKRRKEALAIKQSFDQAVVLYFYGGTQLSTEWFRFNMLPLWLTLLAAKLHRVPVYFGPQQYGPQSPGQLALMRWTLALLVRAARVRNPNCLDLLGLPTEALLYDEVYSCTELYPIIAERSGLHNDPYLLINVRGSIFVDNDAEPEFATTVALIKALQQRLGLPIKIFQMSGPSFCDDQKILDHLAGHDLGPIEVVPVFRDEYELIKLAQGAYGMVSMSFHGCMFGMIGGCPALPLSSGGYYDYKYVDYERYTGGQSASVVFLDRLDPEATADMIVTYFANYDAARTAATRRQADSLMQAWYQRIAVDLAHANHV